MEQRSWRLLSSRSRTLLLFLLYAAELFDIIASLGPNGHSYADDTQVYISAPVVESQQAATRLAECIELLVRWMGQNGLKLNAKTQLLWLGSQHQLAKLTVSQLPLVTSTLSSTNGSHSVNCK